MRCFSSTVYAMYPKSAIYLELWAIRWCWSFKVLVDPRIRSERVLSVDLTLSGIGCVWNWTVERCDNGCVAGAWEFGCSGYRDRPLWTTVYLLCAFTNFWKATSSFVMCVSVWPSAWSNLVLTGRIFMTFDVWYYSKICLKKKFH